MNICTKCGSPFEGSFCPECGTKWCEKGICPECGAKVEEGEKFCKECGAKILTEKKPEKKKGLPPVFSLLIRALPAGLLLFFSLALFVCYALNAMSFWDMGVGNMYALATDPEWGAVQGWAISFIVLAVLLLLYSFVYLAVSLIPWFKKLLAWRIGLPEICGCVAVGGYFLTVLLAIGYTVQLSNEEAELGLGMIFAIILAILFLFCGAGAVALWIVLFGGKEKERQEAVMAERRGVEPQVPERMEKPVFVVEGERRSLLKKLWAKRLVVTAMWAPILGAAVAGIVWLSLQQIKGMMSGDMPVKIEILAPLAAFGCVFIGVVFLSLAFKRSYNFKLNKKIASFGFTFTAPFIIMFAAGGGCALVFGGLFLSEMRAPGGSITFAGSVLPNFLAFVFCFAVAATGLAGLIILKKLRGKMAEYVSTEEFAALAEEYEKDVRAYKDGKLKYEWYKPKWNVYRYQFGRYKRGKSYDKLPKYPILWLCVHKWVALLLACVIALGAVGVCAAGGGVIYYHNYIFRASKIDNLSVGDSQKTVVKKLGEPHYDSSEDELWGDYFEGGTVYEYYSKEYRDMYEQYMNAVATNSLGKAMQLEAKMAQATYECVRVTFDASGNVAELLYDSQCGNSSAERQIDKTKCTWLSENTLTPRIVGEDGATMTCGTLRVGDIKAETYYTDGSYRQYALSYEGEITDMFVSSDYASFTLTYSAVSAWEVMCKMAYCVYDFEEQIYFGEPGGYEGKLTWKDSWGSYNIEIESVKE